MLNAYEMADDPSRYRAERAEYERARAIVRALMAATGAHVARAVVVDDAVMRARALEHFAERVKRARSGFLGDPCWQPTPGFMKQLAAAGVTWADVEERARG